MQSLVWAGGNWAVGNLPPTFVAVANGWAYMLRGTASGHWAAYCTKGPGVWHKLYSTLAGCNYPTKAAAEEACQRHADPVTAGPAQL